MRRGRAPAAVAATLGVAVLACGLPTPPDDVGPDAGAVDGGALPLAAGDRVLYGLAWSWDGAVRDGDAWVVTNDLGYEIGVTSLHLATVRAELVPCGGATGDGVAAWRWGPGDARADHVTTSDVSRIDVAVVEDAADGAARDYGVGTAGATTYCQAFVLAAPLDADGADGFALAGDAIAVAGWYRAPGGARTDFDARVPLGDGGLRDLAVAIPASADVRDGDGVAAAVRVVVTRHPAAALDGIAPDQLGDAELAWAVMRGLLATATATWQRGEAG
ncbi:MAG: hypothetical protein H6709_24755 [Kofleriaceae bacterium]|nr:hypothetical protein [Kofleriaceae bacterium]MCB9575299.1 hypothetical protein [Kofleriaceae bacterium]